MSLIYIANRQGQQTNHEEEEARKLWNSGAISRDSLYWHEGMPEWRPAVEYFASADLPASSSATQEVQAPRGFTNDPTLLTKRLITLLWAYLCAAALAGLVSVIGLLTGQATKADPEVFTAMDLLNLLVGLPQLVIVIMTGVFFLRWIYRANLNARGFGASGMTFTPGWSVGWYFIPIFNLWKPYRAMQEIWQASENPSSWQSQKAPAYLGRWWGFWIASCLLGNAAFRASLRADSPSELMVSEVVSLLSDLVDIPLCLVAMGLVRDIIRRQSRWAEQRVPSACTVCQQPFPPSEMITLNGSPVCAQCKPVLVQRIQEGVAE